MKPFALFTFDDYYPSGGWNDFYGDFDTEEECMTLVNGIKPSNWQVVDVRSGRIKAEGTTP